ncbi:N-acetylneuraminate lyase [Rubripirellula lacrimiformis]|uniref:N-acetylneuraminate lyase n=1 Tax=Rubripirellula lacrimiformis TaxID=1930273 RepID=A0A517NET5_9BACT|nr:dihydrodipicolinate synthase family protein [Rubripirellula lacrimiformis]QDT05640.1 N-acetylneuraminate lyase [Rubripirellula lacrimiformis]
MTQQNSVHRLQGLIAATYTPMNRDGSLNLAVVPEMVQHLIRDGVSGIYVCGSTGEGMSLTSDERRQVAQSYVTAVDGRLPVIVQVGHNSLAEAKQLAAHASEIGADIVSATCPSYFKVSDVPTLVDCMADLASAAADLPFYYYHIPILTGSTIQMADFLEHAADRIPNLAGLKYTDTKLFEFQHCLELADRKFDVVWGCDEMLLGAIATGAEAAIGSTYNIAAPVYQHVIDAVAAGDLPRARRWQARSIDMIRTMGRYPFHSAMKAVLAIRGLDFGGCRLPQGRLSQSETETLQRELDAIGFFEWSSPQSSADS